MSIAEKAARVVAPSGAWLALSAAMLTLAPACAAGKKPPPPPIATTDYRTAAFSLSLRSDTQTLARLSPLGDAKFSFTPASHEAERQENGFVHLGDLHLRLRVQGGEWQDFSSARNRAPIKPLAVETPVLAAADISATMGQGLPLSIERRWVAEGDALVLRFTFFNSSAQTIEIGGLGLPMVFDNIISERSLEQAHTEASFVDPYIGNDAGYLQVTRLNGSGPALLVLPDTHSPLEAYRPILNPRGAPAGDIFTDRTPHQQTFEGFYDWTIASRGFAMREWRGAGEPWNEPSEIPLAPGERRVFGVRLVQSPSIRAIENTLIAHDRPVAIGIPGYVVPTDLDATLLVHSSHAIRKVEVTPAGALSIDPAGDQKSWARYRLRGKTWGRARLTITYADDSVQTVHYFVTKPAAEVAADLGRFTTTQQFFTDASDPFKRAPAILSYDRSTNKILAQETRAWIAGMSDEGGAGSWVAAIAKQLDNPDAEEVAKLERVVTETVFGKLQVAEGKSLGAVRKSLFYYEPARFPHYYDASLDWTSWTSWPKKGADDLGRAYNYPHVAIGHWVLYRLARFHQGLVKTHDWRWYLGHAYLTTTAMMRDAPYYAQFGLMEGEIFVAILDDLKREGMTAEAADLEKLMKGRADHWKSLPYPFGSEMPWDSTGQPEVYAWLRYFGDEKEAAATREVILGYDPTIPSWGYNGNARRYWDFLYAGKLTRIERQIHHYGSALNAVPLLDAYRANPADLYLLRVGYGGLMGALTNIDQAGFGSAAFHSNPDQMRFDAITGDYGMGFFGHASATASYLVNDETFGWLGFGGNVTESGEAVRLMSKDSGRSRVFIAPAGLWLTLAAGKFESVDYSPTDKSITVRFAAATSATPTAWLTLATTTAFGKRYAPAKLAPELGAFRIPLAAAPTELVLTPQ